MPEPEPESLPDPRSESAAVTALLCALIDIGSVNPEHDPSSAGEGPLASALLELGDRLGWHTALDELLPGRPNVRLRVGDPDADHVLAIEVHTDTVGESGDRGRARAVVDGGRVHGRGACDVKGGLTAALVALASLTPPPDAGAAVELVATVDEEFRYRGITHHLARNARPTAAIAMEPTELRLVTAHNGVLRVRITVAGLAAHTSTPQRGRNAVVTAMELHATIGAWLRRRYAELPGGVRHTLTTIEGGRAHNVVPDRAVFTLDIRTPATIAPEAVAAELSAMVAGLADAGDPIVEVTHVDPGLHTPEEADVVDAMASALGAAGRDPRPVTVPFCTDASKLAAAGVPSVVFGPGSIDQAHADDEWVEIADVITAAQVVTGVGRAWLG